MKFLMIAALFFFLLSGCSSDDKKESGLKADGDGIIKTDSDNGLSLNDLDNLSSDLDDVSNDSDLNTEDDEAKNDNDFENIQDSDNPSVKPVEWTLIYFISSDGDYKNYNYMFNIRGLEAQGGSNSNLHVTALYDGFEKGDSLYYYIQKTVKSETFPVTTAPGGEVDMGDTKAYFDMIDWVVKNYPAKKYYISFHDHGGGAVEPSSGKYLKNMLYDQTGGSSLDPDEQAEVVKYLSEKIGHKVDVVESMTCLGQMIENTFGMGGYAKYHIGAESLSYVSQTYPVSFLTGKPDATSKEVADYIIKDHEKGILQQNVPCHWSLINLDEIKPLADMLKALADALMLEKSPETAALMREIAGKTQNFTYQPGDRMASYIDIMDFAENISSNQSLNSTVKSIASEIKKHVSEKLVEYNFINNGCHPQTTYCAEYDRAHGISIYHPNDNNPFYIQNADPLYESLSFAEYTGWDNYLKKISLEAPTGQLPKVENLKAELTESRKVKISWNYSDDNFMLYDAFYCSRDKDGVFTNVYYTVVKEKGKTYFEVIDNLDESGNFRYRVTAFRGADSSSVNWSMTEAFDVE